MKNYGEPVRLVGSENDDNLYLGPVANLLLYPVDILWAVTAKPSARCSQVNMADRFLRGDNILTRKVT